ncbi:MAG: MutS-related protein [Planctomycetota bacterium]
MTPPDHASAAEAAAAAAAGLGRRRNWASLSRLVCFAALAFLFVVSIHAQSVWPILGVFALGTCFLLLALWIARIDEAVDRQHRLESYHRHGQDRMAGRWNHAQDDGSARIEGWHPYARDLDLIGPGGLYQLLNTAGSEAGRSRLAAWLFADGGEGQGELTRAPMVRSLCPAHAWRAALAVGAGDRSRHRGPAASDPYGAWAAAPGPQPPAWVAVPVWILRLSGVALLVSAFINLGPEGLWLALLAVGIAFYPANWWCIRRHARKLDPEPARAQAAIQARALEHLAAAPADEPEIDRLRRSAQEGAAALGELARILEAHAKRANVLWALLGSIVVNEWRNVRRLHAWAQAHGARRAQWIDTLGRGEALACLATFAAEQGGVWPELAGAEDGVLAVTDLAHPLLPRDQRVGNDLVLSPGQVLMLTGANASGKSTFLRSCALAMLMARMGLPVCAASCRLRPMRLATVMRVQDDLLHGRSRFQAEVETLRRVLDRVEADPSGVMLVLDEILGGTNSRERHLGTRAIIEHLAGGDGVVLVSTHDLELTRLADAAPERFHLAYFADRAVLERDADAEQTDTGAACADVVFDYQLRRGVLQSTNALRVMRAAGLPVEGAQG